MVGVYSCVPLPSLLTFLFKSTFYLYRWLGLNNLIIELDALSIVILMNNEAVNVMMEPLLSNCRNLLKQIPNKCVIHSYCKANQCADTLAKLGAQSFTHFVVFCHPPLVVETLLAFDKANIVIDLWIRSLILYLGLPKKRKKKLFTFSHFFF